MDLILRQGRLLFALSIAAFGVLNLIWARTTDPLLPVIPWVPGHADLAYAAGAALLAAGICVAANFKTRVAATLLGFLFLLCVVNLQVPNVVASPWDVGVRTCAFETLAMCASAWMLAAGLPSGAGSRSRWSRALNWLIGSGRYLFAASMIVFGVDHYIVFNLIVGLIPSWIPGGGWFWTHVTALAFIAAGLSIAFRWLDRCAAALLGMMFMLWVLVLHGPRVLSYPRCLNPNEWSSAFIALGVCGGAWILAWSIPARSAK
jgi:hypothetical protein